VLFQQVIAAPPEREAPPASSPRQDDSPVVGGRDLRIDLLRGFCVLAMVVDHIGGPSVLYALTGGNRFYTSAAEAFIFISGLVMGLAYRRIVERDGLGGALRRAMERTLALYLLTITLTLLFIPAWEFLATRRAQGVDFQDPAGFIVSVLTLHRTYYLVDIPLLYTFLIFVAPAAMALLSQGKTALVLAGSWTLWALYQFFPEQTDMPWTIAGNYLFYASAWQVFFFTGLVVGWHHSALRQRLATLPQRALLILSGLGFAALVILYHLVDRLPRILSDPELAADIQLFLLEVVFGKSDVRPGRIAASIIVFGFFFLLVSELWRPLHRAVGWFLLPLGMSALYAYAAHVVLAVPVAVLLDALAVPDRYARPVNAAAQVAVLAAIWLLIKGRVLFVSPSQGRARYLWPVAAMLTCAVLLPLDPSPSIPGFAHAAPEQDPLASRVARAFGTPMPGAPPRGEGTPVPLPRPSLRQVQTQLRRGEPRVSEYVGNLRGTFRNMQFFSRALDRDMPYFIYLPPGYDDDNRRYPVLYLLHGNSGHYEEWAAYGVIDRADRMIATYEILPMIIVLPQGDFSYWVNLVDGPAYGDYTRADLVRHIGATYRVLPGREHRAIGGLSMGGTGALINAFRFPQEFGVVGAHSPSLPDEGSRDFLGEGQDFALRDPISLARQANRLHDLWIWIDAGNDDDWLPRVEILSDTLEERGIDHQLHIPPGDHDDTYWRRMVPEYLRFYDSALNPERRP
jgi:enterochelin esterase-like enzyme